MNHIKLSAKPSANLIAGILAPIFFGVFLYSHPAYATFSASISRSGTVNLAEAGSSTIRPTSAGTLGTGSDTVSVTTNCTYGGYKLYVSATSTGGTALKLPDNSDSIPTSSTTVGSETTLARDTWGVGKTASAFSGLQAYTDDIGMLTPFYTGTSSDSYSFYYGVNVSTAKTPGIYTGEVLYTVLMDEACTKYTLNFNGNSATINNVTPQSITFDDTINLADISSASKIARTGYTLTGWKDQSGNSYGITGTVDINPNDLASITLTAQWSPNTLTITYDANGGTGVASKPNETAYYGTNITMPTKNTLTKTGYDFLGWSLSSTAASATWTAGQTNVAPTAINGNLSSKTGLSTTVYAVWKSSCNPATDMQCFTCSGSGLSTGQQKTLVDIRDNHNYTVKKLPDGKCWMVQNLALGMDVAEAGLTLTPANTNIDDGKTYYLPPAGKQGSGTIDDSSTLTATDAAHFAADSNMDAHSKTEFRAKNNDVINDSDTGYYNFYTTTLGYSYYNDNVPQGSSTRDICPRGWGLPQTTDAGTTVSVITTANDFTHLARQYSASGWVGTATTSSYAIDGSDAVLTGVHTGVSANGNNYAGFSYAGYYADLYGRATLFRLDLEGSYWSSSVYDLGNAYRLNFYTLLIAPQDRGGKYLGNAVRCVAKS